MDQNTKLDSLEMSKKRNQKIVISEEAIRKVPYIQYKEVPEQEYDIIQNLAKRVLELSKERNNSNEVAITYSYDPEMVLAGEELIGVHFGDEHSVDPLADPQTFHLIMKSQECAVVSLHNHNCVKHQVPFVLAGSIRDDGSLPKVYGNVYEAQDTMRSHVRKATTVICLATMLHTIATGNMTPSFRVLPDGTIREVYF